METALKHKVKQSKTVDFPQTIRLTQSILKCKLPSVDKPLQKLAPQKGPLKNTSPGAYFRDFTVHEKKIMLEMSSLTSKKNEIVHVNV